MRLANSYLQIALAYCGGVISLESPNAAAVAPVDEAATLAATLAATPTSQLALQLFFGTIFELRTLTRKMFGLCRN